MSFERGSVVICTRDAGSAPGGVPVVATIAHAGAADVVVLEPSATIADGAVEALAAARGDDGTVATVSAVTAAGEARLLDAPLRPRVLAPIAGCVLVTRAALDLCGPYDDGFAERASAAGLLHVLADDVIVQAAEPPAPKDEPEPAARARWRARQRASGPLTVTFDGRILRDSIAGTQVHTLELLAALHRTQALRLRVLLAESVTDTARAVLDTLDGLEYVNQADVLEVPESAVVHRPYQISSAPDLLTLRHVGERLVVTHQDLIGYHNPTYHLDREHFLAFRQLTRTALAAAHRVVAFSHHVGADLTAEDLVSEDRLRVVHIGVDHRLTELAARPRAPQSPPSAPYLLCLGTDLRHKNRPFAMHLLRELRALGWDGSLVLAGPPVAAGSSTEAEAAILAAHPDLATHVVDAGTPDEPEKAWLYAHAAGVVYPTTYEGFGLIPFEAAVHGVPCLFAPQASLVETLHGHDTLVPWDAQASAARVRPLLDAGPERQRLVDAVRAAAQRLTWDATAQALLPVYEESLALPADLGWSALQVEAERREWEHRYWTLFNGIGPTGLSLVSGEERLLPEEEQRALAALLQRPASRRPLLALLGAARKAAKR
ncbi:glycosyltransferase involved in cell wall biosynthesis [Solirubrobacter pauli]|uniref:Glycosyltransferase involved in cell wall biosynthesis n=1 Tax=Solirubrobacter pauli TaxID=166793 RepID=A0A660LFA5_9ACTN|nr:glycosyltransferase [Solirubrobacter pauli]RKQ92875.1 glycosyltransferase involved in cell wall biosynthesis [Solirubrobacter pauli]